MTQPLPDALADLRTRRPTAPAEVRERVRLIAASQPSPPRRLLTWRRAAMVLAPAAVGALVLGIALRPGVRERETGRSLETITAQNAPAKDAGTARGAPAPTPTRIQDYDAFLRLRVRDGAAVSSATRRALAVARGLGGYAVHVSVSNWGGSGDAEIRVRVPVSHVQRAVARLSTLGTVLGERVEIQDLQTGVDEIDRELVRLQRRLRELRAQPQTNEIRRRVTELTRSVERLQRRRAATARTARLATVSLELTTKAPEPPAGDETGPLDGAWTALRWIGIGLLYGLIVGGPFVVLAVLAWIAWRIGRRRAEARLLERA